MLTVIVAIHNTNLLLFKRMLGSLLKYAPEMTQLVVVDNASEDELFVDVLFDVLNIEKGIENKYAIYTSGKREYEFWFEYKLADNKTLILMRSDTNNGFGCAHNDAVAFLCAQKKQTEYIAIVNDDVEWFENWSTPMIKTLDGDVNVKQVGMMMGVCNKLTPTGQAYGQWVEDVDYCEGSCFMMHFKDAMRYGPFDDAYKFAYYEDTDLSLRIRKDGFKIKAVFVNWIHHRAATSSKAIKEIDIAGYRELNKRLFHKRWNSFLFKGRHGKYIVICRTGSIGDVFLTTPIAQTLKEKYSDCVIAIATQCPQLVEKSPVVDVIIKEPYVPFICDIFIDLDNSYERDFSSKHIVDVYAEKAGLKGKLSCKTGILGVGKESVRKIDVLIAKDQRPFVVLDLSDSWSGKQWLYERYVELGKLINKDNRLGVILIGNVSDYNKREYIECDVDLINQLPSLQDTAVLLSKASLYIGHEGVVAHIAQALQELHHIILYGCSKPWLVNDTSLDTWHGVVTKAVCRGCRHVYAAGNTVLCSRNHQCMGMITVGEVFEKYKEVLNK